MKILRATWAGLTSVAVLAVPLAANAQAFGLNEMGACAVGRSYAVAANGCKDASNIFANPAATTSLTGWSLVVGASDIAIYGTFERDSTHAKYATNIPHAIVPHFFVNHHAAGSRVAYGLGFYVPYGLTSQWPVYFPGVFAAQKSALATFYIQPNIAWQLNDKWSVGVGPIFGHSTVELVKALDLAGVPASGSITFGNLGFPAHTQFATADLKGSANGFGAQIGISGKLNDDWTVGLRAMTPVKFNYNGATATFTQVQTGLVLAGGNILGPNNTSLPAGTPVDAILAPQFAAGGAFVNQSVSTSITHPGQVQAGVKYSGFKDWDVEADYQWVGWNSFHELPINFAHSALNSVNIEDYNNTSTLRLAAEYSWMHDIKLRAGYSGVASAAPPETVTPLLPEQDRKYANAGFALPFGSHWTLDAAYSHVFTAGRRGRVDDRPTRALTAAQLNTGVYTLSGDILSFTFKAAY